MREFDYNGFLLAGLQAKIFEKSVSIDKSSSLIFLRRFQKSTFASKLDKENSAFIDFRTEVAIENINKEFGGKDYGSMKYSAEAMYWMGYLYRYICYTREVSTRYVFKLINPMEMYRLFHVFHTQSEEWCIRSILEMKGITEEQFDINYRAKKHLEKIL